ncbi:MAG: SUMF1/EgtB/PvdO family nonheme iron enzyme [Verrucomicrobiae bacterium]|nr:SUMF1/EgtB/PvdO family nonheme iron enzyme [Verrucomicrobiae bacterium]
MRASLSLALLATLVSTAAFRLEAGTRSALVLGNNAYAHARALANPVNDATAMAGLLGNLGFSVSLHTDADLRTMRAALRDFVASLPANPDADAVALVYYAGHGVQIAGRNYLVPVDAEMARDYEVPDETLAMDTLMSALESAGAGLNLLVLDCCRDDPFSRSWRGSRSVDAAGLALPGGAPRGMFIAFSTSPGDTAEDGEGDNSPYTSALLRHLPAPGKPFEEVFKAVGGEVSDRTGGEQEPWFNSKFYGDFRFVGEGGEIPGRAKEPGQALASQPWANSLGLEFVPVPGKAGTLMARTETRVRDFRAFVRETGYAQRGGAHLFAVKKKADGGFTTEWNLRVDGGWEKPGFEQGEDHPVVCVSWDEASAFCRWLSEKEGRVYRLPTDAEWSAAIGSGRRFPWGDEWPAPPGAGNFWDHSAIRGLPGDWKGSVLGGDYDDGIARTARVASFAPNPHGFFDLGGNVWEWLADDYDPALNPPDLMVANPSLRETRDPKGRAFKILRGGAWDNFAETDLRADLRDYDERDRRDDDYGFRMVLEVTR